MNKTEAKTIAAPDNRSALNTLALVSAILIGMATLALAGLALR